MLQQSSLTKTSKEKKPHQQDKYQGQLDPKTKERHGKGVYHFNNHYFEYEGSYEHNLRHGPGVLKLANGTKIEANFVHGQIEGDVKVTYADGTKYIGGMSNGEKYGYGQSVSEFQNYKGQWLDNKKHGEGQFQTTSYKAKGQFVNNKLDGQATLTYWDSEYVGGFKDGKKDEFGKLTDQSQGIIYEGQYKQDLRNGKGKLKYTRSGFEYEGEFKDDKPVLVANEFEVKVSFTKSYQGEQKKTEYAPTTTIEYELEGDPFSLEVNKALSQIRSCYQGPMQLDEIQPTADEIDKQVKAWQEANKKNKNPPPMPDFNQPRMKKPELLLVDNQSGRKIGIELFQVVQGKQDKKMRVDYRADIVARRAEIDGIKKENAKKAEEQGDKKKAAKKQGKGGQPQLKVNLYKQDAPESTKQEKLRNQRGTVTIENLEYPDDFPSGKYYLLISNISRQYEGEIPPTKIQFSVNSKGTAAAKNAKKK